MVNRYRFVRELPVGGAPNTRDADVGPSPPSRGVLVDGLHLEGISPETPLGSATVCRNVVVGTEGMQRGDAYLAIGDPVMGETKALGDLALSGNPSTRRAFRLVEDGGSFDLYTFHPINGWTNIETLAASPGSNEQFSSVALQEALAFAGGDNIVVVHNITSSTADSEVPPSSPGAYYVFEFADRLLGIGDFNDHQILSWSVSGNILDWTGVGSGSAALISPRLDPVDGIECGAALSSELAVLIRQRSIMRVFRTGNIDQAVGAVHWMQGVGTHSPQSLAQVPSGVMFLTYDDRVVHLTEQGPVYVDGPIRKRIVSLLAGGGEITRTFAQGAFEAGTQIYWLGVPTVSPLTTTEHLLGFDVGEYIRSGKLNWYERNEGVEYNRISGVSGSSVGTVFSDGVLMVADDNEGEILITNTLEPHGDPEWVSQTLNRGDPTHLFELVELSIIFSKGVTPPETIVDGLQVSVDGGRTFLFAVDIIAQDVGVRKQLSYQFDGLVGHDIRVKIVPSAGSIVTRDIYHSIIPVVRDRGPAWTT